VKLSFQVHGISMPDEAREIVFPEGIPLAMGDGDAPRLQASDGRVPKKPAPEQEPGIKDASTKAEAGLYSEAVVIKEQAKQAQPLHEEENLLCGDDSERGSKTAK